MTFFILFPLAAKPREWESSSKIDKLMKLSFILREQIPSWRSLSLIVKKKDLLTNSARIYQWLAWELLFFLKKSLNFKFSKHGPKGTNRPITNLILIKLKLKNWWTNLNQEWTFLELQVSRTNFKGDWNQQ